MKNVKNVSFSLSIKDLLKTISILGVATLLCFILKGFESNDTFVPLLFVLAVLLISFFTEGYICGLLASLVAVFGVNYAFTYPYFTFNFDLTGYPLTFITMFTVSIIVSMLTTRVKQQEKIHAEIEKEKMHSNLLRAVSHDIRTPLTSIVGSTSAYLENYNKIPENKRIELITDVKNEAQWLIRVVENLLSITRINGNEANIKKQLEAAEEIISDTVIKFKKRYPGINVKINIPDEPLFVPVDAILIEQVISNILENAVLHGQCTSQIIVDITRDNNNAYFTFTDNGSGIEDKLLPTIFTDYMQSAETGKSDIKKNMGIGLSVCQSIIKAHGGQISAKNKKGSGAVFEFILPLGQEE